MNEQRYVVMGAGEVGAHLAHSLAQAGHSVTVIEPRADRCRRIEEEIDVLVVQGDGSHVRALEKAEAGKTDLFLAVSSSDEANLAASLLAKRLGAQRTVVRVSDTEQVLDHRKIYEEAFSADFLLSTQLLTTTRILNQIRGHSTMAVEYFANGKVQLRKIRLDADSPLVSGPLKGIEIPEGSLVAALFRGEELIIPSGEDRAQPGDDALIIGRTEVISRFERMVTRMPEKLGTVVIAGGGQTGQTVARSLEGLNVKVRIIERERGRCQQLAARFPSFEVLHGDSTDLSLLKAERIGEAQTFVTLTGHDEANLMASLMAQELQVPEVIALVHKAETSRLWRRLGLKGVLSPRALAAERIHEYIESGYSANMVSLSHGAAQVLERRLYPASAAAGVTLAEMNPPGGIRVAAVVRGSKVFVPGGADRLEVGDLVTLFVHASELDTARLIFPGRDGG